MLAILEFVSKSPGTFGRVTIPTLVNLHRENASKEENKQRKV